MNPLVILKKPDGDPFSKIAKEIEDKHPMIPLTHCRFISI
jgi:hypothetical protein